MIKSFSILVFICFFAIESSAQSRADFFTIDSLRYLYNENINTDEFKNKRNLVLPPPPLPNDSSIRKNFCCKRKYDIPLSEFSKIYPFNADSIIVQAPSDSFDYMSEQFQILGKMSNDEITHFTDLLYNYDFEEDAEVTIVVHNIYEIRSPDIRIDFYNKGRTNSLHLFIDDSNQVRIESFFDINDLYWGEECSDRYGRLYSFFNEVYNYDIHSRSNETSKEELPPLR